MSKVLKSYVKAKPKYEIKFSDIAQPSYYKEFRFKLAAIISYHLAKLSYDKVELIELNHES